jgi:undecaprenyl-phosphate 4-deoxy-4-formamido-L-arabinose transferase
MTGDPALSAGLSVVIPVFNGESNCAELVGRLAKVLSVSAHPFEVLLVNDGSYDRSWAQISELAQEYPWVRGVDLMRNYGQHNALLCGIRDARFDVIVTMDDDLQNPPEEIPRLLDALTAEYDVVYGTPQHERHGLWRDVASQVTKLALQNAMGVEIARNVSAFRAFRTQLRDAFTEYHNPFVSVDVLLTWGTTRFTAIAVRQDPRQRGKSHYTFRKLLTHAINMLTGFSTLPLQLASLMGFVLTLFGAGILVYVLVRYFFGGDPVRGFPFLASVIAIFSGAQLFALGIIGEYLARMHFRMMARPAYVVRSLAIRR